MDVFISYSSNDQAIALAACDALESAGLKCWIAPRNIQPGCDWSEAIISGIEASRVLLLVFSGHANASQQVLREVERAVAKGLAVIPLRVEPVQPSRGLEYFISAQHWLDASPPPVNQHFSRMIASVQALLELPADPVPLAQVSATASSASSRRRWILAVAGSLVAAGVMAMGVIAARNAGSQDRPESQAVAQPTAAAATSPQPVDHLVHARVYERVIRERFPRWDVDRDGHLTLQEASERLLKAGIPGRGILQLVQRLDSNDDRRLSEIELLAMGQVVVDSRDQDGDRRYSLDEFLAWNRDKGGDLPLKTIKSVFRDNDTDHDGFVTVPEMEAVIAGTLRSDR